MCSVLCLILFFFFFSSRRRHTRLQGDWSSDVCSSDLRTARSSSRGHPAAEEDRSSSSRCGGSGQTAIAIGRSVQAEWFRAAATSWRSAGGPPWPSRATDASLCRVVVSSVLWFWPAIWVEAVRDERSHDGCR